MERQHYRIRYPVPDRPSLIVRSDLSLKIEDLSETGLRITLPSDHDMRLQLGDFFRANIRFTNNQSVMVTGRIIREGEGYIVAYLDQGVPLKWIMEEQRLLLQKYNTLELADPSNASENRVIGKAS